MPQHHHEGETDVNGNHHHGTWGEAYGGWMFGNYAGQGHQGSNGGQDWDNYLYNTSTDGQHSHHFTTGDAGKGNAMRIMPLATVVDAWYRTA